MRANFVLSSVATGLRRNVTMTVAIVLSTAIALGFVGAAILAHFEVTKFRTTYEDKLRIQVYLCTKEAYSTQESANQTAKEDHKATKPVTCTKNQATTAAQSAKIAAMLKADPYVGSFSYISQSKALQLGIKQAPTYKNYLQLGDLPASYSVNLKDIRKDYDPFAAKYSALPGVDSVNNPISTIDALLSLIDSAALIFSVVAIFVLAASVLLIANTIQVAASQRRNETSIMRLVGASRWMTELPFMLETMIATVVGGLIALLFISIGKYYVLDVVLSRPTDKGTIPNLSTNELLIAGGAGLLVGIVLSAITALFTLRVYVRL